MSLAEAVEELMTQAELVFKRNGHAFHGFGEAVYPSDLDALAAVDRALVAVRTTVHRTRVLMPAYQPVIDKLLELCTDVRSSCTEDGIPDDDDGFFVSFYLQYVPQLKELLEKFVLVAAQGVVWTPEDGAMAVGHSVDPARWRAMFDQAMARIAGRFRRVEPRATARSFVLGLLSGVERKNCWQLAEQAGHTRPGPMQRLLRSARWDADEVRDEVRSYVLDHLGGDGVLIVDETGFLKKGDRSAGVQRQYTGTARRIENAQVGVFLAYASTQGRALIDRRLYLPEHTWCQDTERRSGSGVPEDVEFARPSPAWPGR
ncbi:transposase [Streptomyces sp. Root55]|uniref:IS701 family transposase n=1 Tax=Streptomyces sp. Root55 TaxID=1736554 RepID=UPI00249E8E80|nr:transposase [Streptomyces sp. Root55]